MQVQFRGDWQVELCTSPSCTAGPLRCGAIRAGPIAGGWAVSKAGLFGMRLPRNPAARSVAKT